MCCVARPGLGLLKAQGPGLLAVGPCRERLPDGPHTLRGPPTLHRPAAQASPWAHTGGAGPEGGGSAHLEGGGGVDVEDGPQVRHFLPEGAGPWV
jgi:hypothetical protein